MLRRFSITFSIFSMVLDGILAGFTLRISGPIRPLLNGLPGVEDVPYPIRLPEELYYLFPILWVGIMLAFAVYDGRKNLRAVDEFSSLTASSILAMVAMAGVLFITYRDVSRVLFFFFCLLTFCLFVGWRAGARWLFRHQLKEHVAQRRILILGAGEGAYAKLQIHAVAVRMAKNGAYQ